MDPVKVRPQAQKRMILRFAFLTVAKRPTCYRPLGREEKGPVGDTSVHVSCCTSSAPRLHAPV